MSASGGPGSGSTPKQLGKYIIEDVLGRGGMGTVYKARDPRMGRLVAIKTLSGNLRDESTLKRFYREAEKTGRLKHANIITIYDLGEEGGHPYIVMEFIEGRALDSIIRDPIDLPLLQKLRIIEQVCLALGYAHANDVIHRDVKPGNVMLRPDGLVKLLDFGIAIEERATDVTLTQTGLVIGTVPYMAPERLLGGSVNGRSDIFATGVLMFQLLTRELPFQGDEVILVNKLLNEPHPPLDRYLTNYPSPLNDVLDRSLAKRPADRYETAEEMASDLSAVIEQTKRLYIDDLLSQAQDRVNAHDPLPARELFLEILKLDPQQATARRTLSELNQQISRRQQIEHAELKRRQAQNAFVERKFDVAIALLQEALKLVPEDVEIAKQLDYVRGKQQVAEQVTSALRQAEEAKRSGEISKALAIVEQALSLDTTNARIRLAYNSLMKQVKDAEQRAGARRLLQSAREELSKNDYDAASSLIREAELLDPANVEVQSLKSALREEVRLNLRRIRVAEIENHIATAVDEEDWRAAASAIQAALAELPSDPLLLRYKVQVDQQLELLAEAKKLDGVVRDSWALFKSSPSEALAFVERMLREHPGDEQLRTIAAEFRNHIGRLSAQEKRSDYLLRARQALDSQDFHFAVEILESCQGDCFSTDIAELLDFARAADGEQRQRRAVRECRIRARKLLNEDKALDAIREIQAVLHDGYDEALTHLLEEARARIQKDDQERESAWARVHHLAAKGLYQQALLAIKSLPPEWATPEISALNTRLQRELLSEQTDFQLIGQAYHSLLSRDPKRDWTNPALSRAQGTQRPGTDAFWAALQARRREVSSAALSRAIQQIQAAGGSFVAGRVEELKSTSRFKSFAESRERRLWTRTLWTCVLQICTRSFSRTTFQRLKPVPSSGAVGHTPRGHRS